MDAKACAVDGCDREAKRRRYREDAAFRKRRLAINAAWRERQVAS